MRRVSSFHHQVFQTAQVSLRLVRTRAWRARWWSDTAIPFRGAVTYSTAAAEMCVSWPSTSGRTLEREPRHAYDLQQLDPDGQVKYGCVAVLLMAQLSTKAKAQERIQVFIYC